MFPSRKSIYEYLNLYRKPTRDQMIAQTIEAAMNTVRTKELYDIINDELNPYSQNPNELLRQYMISQSILAAQPKKNQLIGAGKKNKLKEYQKISLSNHDINNLLRGKTNIMTYPELMECESINDVLGDYDSCALLYLNRDGYGHWCSVSQDEQGKISFFDPYGGKNLPDQELKSIPEHFRIQSGQTYPHLTYLLYKSDKPVEYNEHKYQKWDNDMNTCGRHVVSRLLHKNLNSDQYFDMMKDIKNKTGMDYDEIVTIMTENLKKIMKKK